MAEEGFKRKLAAILSADVVGYSRLMENNEEATIKSINADRKSISTLVEQHRGRVVDSPGDNVLAEFSSVVDAIKCAVEIQKELSERNAELPENRRMLFRIGVNLGDVVEEDHRIYGDGVNIAARLESLAEAGGICISRTAYGQIKNKLTLGYEYLGEHSVKNISDPVHVYKVLMDADAAGKVIGEKRFLGRFSRRTAMAAIIILVIVAGGLIGWNIYLQQSKEVEPESVEKMAFLLPDKPSIAVLAFDNLSGDPEQEYFSAGVSEEIISALSKTDRLFVIARNSSFTYKGKSVNVKQISRELGVRYVLEGSVRKSEDRVRVTAQLIDATTGHHLWSERYDRDLKDIFAVQDEITMKIITALQVKLTEGEQMRMWAKRYKRLDVLLKHMELLSLWRNGSNESFMQVGQVAQEVVDMAPELATGYIHLGAYHYGLARSGVSPRESMKKSFKFSQKAISLDESDGGSHSLLGRVYTRMRQHEKGVAVGKRAIELDPNRAESHKNLGWTLIYSGRPDEAIEYLNIAIRLNPFPPFTYYEGMGFAYLIKGNYEKAITEFKKALQLAPMSIGTHLKLAVAYGLLGREEEARASAEKTLELGPFISVSMAVKTVPFKNQTDLELILNGMRKAGFPEGT